jgi:hypothetical protein
MIRILSIATLFTTVLGACAAQESKIEPGTDELAGEAGDGDAAKADAPHDTFGFLQVHRNAVLCSNPITCTPYRLNRANRSTTLCNDGQYHASCEVHEVAWESLGLSQDQINQIEGALSDETNGTKTGTQVLVRGQYKIYVDFLAFEPTEVWLAQLSDGNDSGTFVQVFDYQTQCRPEMACPQYQEFKLNSSKYANIEDLDFGSDASDALQGQVTDATAASTGAIVVGNRETRSVVDFVDSLRSVNQVYLPVQ